MKEIQVLLKRTAKLKHIMYRMSSFIPGSHARSPRPEAEPKKFLAGKNSNSSLSEKSGNPAYGALIN